MAQTRTRKIAFLSGLIMALVVVTTVVVATVVMATTSTSQTTTAEAGAVMGSSAPASHDTLPAEDTVTCDYPALVGQKIDAVDQKAFGDRVVRVLRPGDAATMDYSPTRININLDDHDTVVSVTCG